MANCWHSLLNKWRQSAIVAANVDVPLINADKTLSWFTLSFQFQESLIFLANIFHIETPVLQTKIIVFKVMIFVIYYVARQNITHRAFVFSTTKTKIKLLSLYFTYLVFFVTQEKFPISRFFSSPNTKLRRQQILSIISLVLNNAYHVISRFMAPGPQPSRPPMVTANLKSYL